MDSIPESRLKIVNIDKYKKMMQTAALLKNVLTETEDSFEINCEVIENFNIGSVSVELDALSINSPSKFAAVINNADCFEIYPLSNDRASHISQKKPTVQRTAGLLICPDIAYPVFYPG